MRRLPILLSLLLLATVVAAPGTAAADEVRARTITLDIEGVRDLLFDHHNQQLYLATPNQVMVFAANGDLRTRITGMSGAGQMDLTDDGTRLWVPLQALDAAIALDTTSLTEVDRIDFAPGFCPESVVALATKLVVGTGCQQGKIYNVPLTGARLPVGQDAGPHYRVTLAHEPAMGDRVLAGDTGLSPTTLYVMDVSGAAPRLITDRRGTGANLAQLAAHPDGTQVVQASGSPYDHNAYSPADLGTVHQYPTTHYPNAAAWSADGSRLAAGTNSSSGTDIHVFAKGGHEPVWTHELHDGSTAPRALALDGDGSWLYAVSQYWTGSSGGYRRSLQIAEVGSEPPVPPPAPTSPGMIFGDINYRIPGQASGRAEHGMVELIDHDTGELLSTHESVGGRYYIHEVPPGEYRLAFYNAEDGYLIGFFPELYSRQPLYRTRDAKIVRITDGEHVQADATLAPLFEDMFDTPFTDDILFLRNTGTTRGCNPPHNTRFCTDDAVTRGEMAAFISRFLDLTDIGSADFSDIDGSVFHDDIRRLATADITRGCNPPANTQFCPDDLVTREQMAAFLVRAFSMRAISNDADFTDIDGSVFHDDIRRLATADITRGCNPPANTQFCPDDAVTRGQMAAFLRRVFLWDYADGEPSY